MAFSNLGRQGWKNVSWLGDILQREAYFQGEAYRGDQEEVD